MRRLIDTVRGWWSLAERIERTTERLKTAVDELEQANQKARGEAHG